MCPDYTTYDNQTHSRHHHHTVIGITGIVHELGNHLESQKGSEAEELTEEAYDNQYGGIAQTVTDTIQE